MVDSKAPARPVLGFCDVQPVHVHLAHTFQRTGRIASREVFRNRSLHMSRAGARKTVAIADSTCVAGHEPNGNTTSAAGDGGGLRPHTPMAIRVFGGGRVAVQMFYAISGFLITYVLDNVKAYQSLRRFYENRALRIFPVYWAMLVTAGCWRPACRQADTRTRGPGSLNSRCRPGPSWSPRTFSYSDRTGSCSRP